MGGATKNLEHGGISPHGGTWVFMGGLQKPLARLFRYENSKWRQQIILRIFGRVGYLTKKISDLTCIPQMTTYTSK